MMRRLLVLALALALEGVLCIPSARAAVGAAVAPCVAGTHALPPTISFAAALRGARSSSSAPGAAGCAAHCAARATAAPTAATVVPRPPAQTHPAGAALPAARLRVARLVAAERPVAGELESASARGVPISSVLRL